MIRPCIFGSHRSIGEMLPQQAERLDVSLPIFANELLIEVDSLNIDSASMRQIAESCNGNLTKIRRRIEEIVATRGKMHNPVTGSGGVLTGRVAEIGPEFPNDGLKIGDIVCSMVSLSLTPLLLREITAIDVSISRVDVKGYGILFASGLYTRLPDDLPVDVAMALCDVAGVAGHVIKMIKPGELVCILGAGRAGLLSLCAARKALGSNGIVIAVDSDPHALNRAHALGVADHLILSDVTRPLATLPKILSATEGKLADVTVATTNVPGCEGSAILATRSKGRVLFFSMATSFTAAALTAEGVGRDVEMIIGNGYTEGWVACTFEIFRENPALAATFRREN